MEKVIIYQYHKCGSQTLINSCNKALKCEVIDAHHSSEIVKELLKNKNDEIIVIGFVRDVFNRHISNFFQHLLKIEKHDIYTFKTMKDVRNASIKDLNSNFLRLNFNEETSNYQSFYDTFNELFQINIYDTPFNYKEGCQVYKNGRIKVIIIRLENCDDLSVSEMLKRELGVNKFKIRGAYGNSMGNLFRNKNITYSEFKESLKIPESLKTDLKKCYNAKFMKYFYSDKERANIISKY